MIAIFDYGAGNLQSVKNTLDAIGVIPRHARTTELGSPEATEGPDGLQGRASPVRTYEVTSDSAGLRRASKIILPGVGHFGQMIRALDDLGVRETLVERIRKGVPFLGICLGLQALFTLSEE